MPIREAIVDSILPKGVEKPIPVRVITTRDRPRPKPQVNAAQTPNGNQPTTTETPPAVESAPSAESLKLGPAASAIARKEQALRQREQAFKAQQAEYAALKEKSEKFDRLTQALSAKKFDEVEKLGLDYNSYSEYKVGQANNDDPVVQKIAALEATIAELKQGQEESTDRDYQAVVSDYRREVSTLVESNPDFSSIKHLGKEGISAVVQLIEDSWNEDDVEMTAEQACKDIEAELYSTAEKFSKFPKLKPATQEEEPLTPPRPSANTLTNTMSPPSGEPRHQKSLQHLSESERYAEARRRVLAKRAQQQGT